MADPISPTDATPLPKPRKRAVRKAAGDATPAAAPKVRKPRTPKAATAPKPQRATRKAAAAKAGDTRAKISAAAGDIKQRVTKAVKDSGIDWNAQADQLKTQAGKAARTAADAAKVKTAAGMEGLSRLISETAGTVDAKLGPQYGDYARQAAQTVAGAAKSLDEKDVDQLLGEARDFVRKSPAVAIGAAAIAGYVLMRLAKGSGDNDA